VGQSPRTLADIRLETRDVCPECRSVTTTVTLKSDTGVYCRWSECGHVWHQERITH